MFRNMLSLFWLVVAAAGAQNSQNAAGDSLFTAGNFTQALAAFDMALKNNPKDSYAAIRIGHCHQALGRYPDALRAYDLAEKLGYPAFGILYRRSRVYSLLKNPDESLRWLRDLVAAGFPNVSMLKNEKDLDFVRSDRRFEAVVARADTNARPCMFIPEWRQFDFWIGDWDVFTPQGQLAGQNTIQFALDGCLLVENWTSSLGGSGKSINFYDREEKAWRQIWVANNGTVTEFQGIYDQTERVLKFRSRPTSGRQPLYKLFFYPLTASTVRQYCEQSTDGGQTWTIRYDFTYVRRENAKEEQSE